MGEPLTRGLGVSPGLVSGRGPGDARPARSRPPRRAPTSSSSGPRPRPTTSPGWSGRSGSSPRPAGSRATPRSWRAAGGSPRWSARPRCGSAPTGSRSTGGRSPEGDGPLDRRRDGRRVRGRRVGRRDGRARGEGAARLGARARDPDRGGGGRGAARRDGAAADRAAAHRRTTRSGCCSSRATRSRTSWGTRCGVAPDEAQALLDALVADGTAEAGAGAFRLTSPGRERATALLAEDRETWGADAATGALDAFLDLDRRMKAVVTAWQIARSRDAQRPRRRGLRRGGARHGSRTLHRDVEAWLAPLDGRPAAAGALRRAARSAAAEAAAAGNGKFVASPRVDSYHGAWFELHEDLILLAGRTRADEVAAGRA